MVYRYVLYRATQHLCSNADINTLRIHYALLYRQYSVIPLVRHFIFNQYIVLYQLYSIYLTQLQWISYVCDGAGQRQHILLLYLMCIYWCLFSYIVHLAIFSNDYLLVIEIEMSQIRTMRYVYPTSWSCDVLKERDTQSVYYLAQYNG